MSSRRVATETPQDSKLDAVSIIWVDANITSTDSNSKHTIENLKRVCPNISTFTDATTLLDVLKTPPAKHIYIISSGGLGKEVARYCTPCDEVEALFIFCANPANHKTWAAACAKVKGIETKIQPICDKLKPLVESHLSASSSSSSSNPTDPIKIKQLGDTFLPMFYLEYVLKRMKFESQAKDQLADYCRTILKAEGPNELALIDEFQKDYSSNKALWWFTRESFLYRLLNRSLREVDMETIVAMGFFIHDLAHQIEKLYKEQLPTYKDQRLILYRGQGLSRTQYRDFQKNTGGAMTFSSFLSTSRKKNISLSFANQAARQDGTLGVLFVITIDPKINGVPFADVKGNESMQAEESVVISLNSVFFIESANQCEENDKLHEIKMTLTRIDEAQMRGQIRRLEQKLADGVYWRSLIDMVLEFKNLRLGEDLCKAVLAQSNSERDKSHCYNCLGMMKEDEYGYRDALELYQKALAIDENKLSPIDPNLAVARYNIGMLYYEMKEREKAVSFLQKALEIWQQTYSAGHPQIISVTRMLKTMRDATKFH